MSTFSQFIRSWEMWSQSPIAVRLASALLHFLWQGAALAGITGLLLSALKRRSPQVRYAVLLAALGAMAAAPVVTFALLPVEVHEPFAEGKPPTLDAGAPATPAALQLPVETPKLAAVVNQNELRHESIASDSVQPQGPVSLDRPVTPAAPVASRDLITKIGRWFEEHRASIVAAWLVGVCVFSLRALAALVGAEWTRRRGVVSASEPLQRVVAELAARLGIRRTVRVARSALADVPLLVGWLSPVILLPASALSGLTPAQLEAILAHELAHVRRHDYLFNMAQTLVETFLFYHPAVWWISHRIRQEREHCCDDVAVAVCGDRIAYARALATLEELRGSSPRWAVAANSASLAARIRRIVRPEGNPASAWGAVLCAGSCLLVLAVLYLSARKGETAGPAPSNARQASAGSNQTAPSDPLADGRTGRLMHGVGVNSSAGLVGTILLPDEKQSRYRVTLPDGAVLEFLGVCDYPTKGHAWWRPDGSSSAETPDKVAPDDGNGWFPKSIVREFAFNILTDGGPARFDMSESRTDTASKFVFEEALGSRVLRKERVVKVFPENSQTGSLSFNYVGGPWTVFRPRRGNDDITIEARVEFDPATSADEAMKRLAERFPSRRSRYDRVLQPSDRNNMAPPHDSIDVRVTGTVPPMDSQFRVVAVDRENHEHPTLLYTVFYFDEMWTMGGVSWSPTWRIPFGGRHGQERAICWDVPRDQVKEFRILTRPARPHLVEFRNVSLRHGEKTDFEVLLDGERYIGPAKGAGTVRMPENTTRKPDVSVSLDRERPWTVRGRVLDQAGRPVPEAKVSIYMDERILAHSGVGRTDAQGRYELRFGPRTVFTWESSPRFRSQARVAFVLVEKSGFFEKDLCQRGRFIASLEPMDTPAREQFRWYMKSAPVVLPKSPATLDFTLLPAAHVSGTLIDEKGRPLAGCVMAIVGEQMRPNAEWFGGATQSFTETDRDGRFTLENVPTTFPYQINVRCPDCQPPWCDTWATGRIRFADPGSRDFAAVGDRKRLIVGKLTLKLAGSGQFQSIARRLAGPGEIVTKELHRRELGQSEETLTTADSMELTLRTPALSAIAATLRRRGGASQAGELPPPKNFEFP